MIVCDTDILIESFKNNQEIITSLRSVGFENIALSSITVMELYFGAFNKSELQQIKKHLQLLKTIPVNEQISYKAIDLIEQYAKSHNLKIPDSLIAATAIYHDLELMTINTKDFRYIEGLVLYYWN